MRHHGIVPVRLVPSRGRSYLRLHTFKLTAHIEVFALGPHWGRGHRGLKHGAVVGLYGG